MILHTIHRSAVVPKLLPAPHSISDAPLRTAADIAIYRGKHNTAYLYQGALITLVKNYDKHRLFSSQYPLSKLCYLNRFYQDPSEIIYISDYGVPSGSVNKLIPAVMEVITLSDDLKPDPNSRLRPDILEGYTVVSNHGVPYDALQDYIKAQTNAV